MTGLARKALTLGSASLASGCGGIQSALQPTGREAADVELLFMVVTWLSVAITLLVLAAIAVALWGSDGWRSRLGREWPIIGGGIVLPVLVLSGLLAYGLIIMNIGASRASRAEGPGITVIGKQWWWKVVYTTEDGQRVVSANELRIPIDRPVALRLETEDVIHSFWVPQLAGKLDMIPGRTNTLTIEADEPGISRGQCAEYCGGAHALMSFYVVAMPPDAYEDWLAAEAAPAQEPGGAEAREGKTLFMENGCGGCHAIRGTQAKGTIGPDLTHVGGRHSLGAATLANDAEAFANWIRNNQRIKPDNLMPGYRNLERDELSAIAIYLEGLD
ncbi:cytochrome c oxidase subunit II [Roseibium salinum]|uniref:Cytochrome aa3 subunit 2 n=1 Tax=Roseibium salinum TaxID=1604349 RepID=A0ABT3QXC2_9HYPH|nr:cytochrome c oxidase subunit II [Roseibium sp. DSM 29163]MCX2721552.1 cytochrome c oxidase subunit II [Roseibium sp. DSM 29163]MDN3722026.1 cytochrome c oxidase subunit II [Roseibium salinum]